MPKIAPGGADRERVRVEQQRAEGAAEERGEVEGDEAGRADRRLEHAAEEEEGEHVEADVDQAGVEEAAGDEPVPLAFGDQRPVEAEVDDDRAAADVVEAAAAAGDLGEEGERVERDQDEGRRRAREQRRPRRPPAPPWCAGWRTPDSASRPGSASCSRGRSAARRRSRRRRSRDRGAGNRSQPRGSSSLQSRPMDGPSPARLYATAVGAALVVAGIVGFFYSASFGSPGEVDEVFGVFAVNGWDNVLHILTGALGLLVAGYASRRYALWLGRPLPGPRALGLHARQRRGDPRLPPGQHRRQPAAPRPRRARACSPPWAPRWQGGRRRRAAPATA